MKKTILIIVWSLLLFVNLCIICGGSENETEFVQMLSDLKICEINLHVFTGMSLFQKGLFYRKTALLNARVQEKYLRAMLKDLQHDQKIQLYREKIYYYLGLALYVQKNWGGAYQLFDKATNDNFTETMKAACFKQLNDKDAYKKIIDRLPKYFKELCQLRINFEHPLKTNISMLDKGTLTPIEQLVWQCCQSKSLDLINENSQLVEEGVCEKANDLLKIYLYNPLNFFYLSDLLLQKAKDVIKREISEKHTKNSLNCILRDYCHCEALIFFREYDKSLDLISNLKTRINNNPLILSYLSLLHAKCLMGMGQKQDAAKILSNIKSDNNTLSIQIALLQMEWFPEKLKKNLSQIIRQYQPRHCGNPHSLHWGKSCEESCIPWYYAVGQGYIYQKDYQTASRYYKAGFSSQDSKNILSCLNMLYLVNLLNVEFECKNEDEILQYVLNASTFENVVPEIKQMRLALRMIDRYKGLK